MEHLERLGHRYFTRWQLDRAIHVLSFVARQAATRDFAPFMLEETYRRRGDWEEATRWYLESYQRGRTDLLTMFRCAEGMYRQGQKSDARAWFEYLVAHDVPGPRLEQARALLERCR